MRLLLDTHVVLWWLLGDRRLRARVRGMLEDRDANEAFVSAATGWEIATKHRLGKLAVSQELVSGLPRHLQDQAFVVVPITLVHAVRAGALRSDHRDPFDRMIAAQAEMEGLTIASVDTVFDDLGVRRVW